MVTVSLTMKMSGCKHEIKPKVKVSSGASFQFVRPGSVSVRKKTTGFANGETDELVSSLE